MDSAEAVPHFFNKLVEAEIVFRTSALNNSVAAWEQHNSIHLPNDLKTFYNISDGLRITYHNLQQESVVINSISHLHRVLLKSEEESTSKEHKFMMGNDLDGDGTSMTKPCLCCHLKAYRLSGYNNGYYCLVYNARAPPSIWFLDRSLEWHFVSPNFSAFFRLVVTGSLRCTIESSAKVTG